MISPFEVYLVMQLDTIGNVSSGLSFALGVLSFIAVPLAILAVVAEEDFAPVLGKIAWASTLTFFISLLITAFLPSTKTAAAMIVLPAITSDEMVQPLGNEAKELYDLAKDALRKAVDTPTKTEDKAHVE